jgi:dihydroorotate dehydrogenase (NAD+) catalytic subunit
MIELAPQHKTGLALANPVMNAAGILGFANEYRSVLNLQALGAFVSNPTTLNPRSPAHPPNAIESEAGLLVHTGLPNPGVRRLLRRYDKDWQRLGPPVLMHLAATTAAEVALSLEYTERSSGVSGIELGLRDDASNSEAARSVSAALGALPVIVRLPISRAVMLAPAVAAAGANALVISAPPRTAVVIDEREVSGRLYGPGCFASALETLSAVRALGLGLPLIGAGGIYSVENARAMLDAGAVAIQVDAAIWRQPAILAEILAAIAAPP